MRDPEPIYPRSSRLRRTRRFLLASRLRRFRERDERRRSMLSPQTWSRFGLVWDVFVSLICSLSSLSARSLASPVRRRGGFGRRTAALLGAGARRPGQRAPADGQAGRRAGAVCGRGTFGVNRSEVWAVRLPHRDGEGSAGSPGRYFRLARFERGWKSEGVTRFESSEERPAHRERCPGRQASGDVIGCWQPRAYPVLRGGASPNC